MRNMEIVFPAIRQMRLGPCQLVVAFDIAVLNAKTGGVCRGSQYSVFIFYFAMPDAIMYEKSNGTGRW